MKKSAWIWIAAIITAIVIISAVLYSNHINKPNCASLEIPNSLAPSQESSCVPIPSEPEYYTTKFSFLKKFFGIS